MKKLISIFLICITASLFARDAWGAFKKKTISTMKTMPGWCSTEKAHLMMDIIKKNKCRCCVEIGVFSGMSLLPIAEALRYNGSGKVFAIDAWDLSEAIKGFSSSDPHYLWWSQLDFDYFYHKTLKLIKNNELQKFCSIIRQPSQSAACLFIDETIDFIGFVAQFQQAA